MPASASSAPQAVRAQATEMSPAYQGMGSRPASIPIFLHWGLSWWPHPQGGLRWVLSQQGRVAEAPWNPLGHWTHTWGNGQASNATASPKLARDARQRHEAE